MSRSYFTTPKTETLAIGDRTITVRRRLSHGEREDMFAQQRPAGGSWRMVRTAKVLAYLLDWTLTDDAGKLVPMSPSLPENERLDAVRSLAPDVFDDIFNALEAHEKTVQAEVDAAKNPTDGGAPSSATSPSA